MNFNEITQNPGFASRFFLKRTKFRNLSDSSFYLVTKRKILVLAGDRGLWRLFTKGSRAGQFAIF